MQKKNNLIYKLLNTSFIFYCLEKVLEKILTYYWTALFKLKCLFFGIKVGKRIEIFGNCITRKYPFSNIQIGNHVQLISSSWRSSTANCHKCKLRTFSSSASIIFEDNSGMTGGVVVARSKQIRIGKNCMIAPNVVITDSDWHNVWPPKKRKELLSHDADAGVTLEENVWIGMNVLILKGVTIGQNCVIAAGSVVTKSIPQNCLAGGNPAKVIKQYVGM